MHIWLPCAVETSITVNAMKCVCGIHIYYLCFNSLRLEQNGQHFQMHAFVWKLLYPLHNKVVGGYIGFTPFVCLSVRPTSRVCSGGGGGGGGGGNAGFLVVFKFKLGWSLWSNDPILTIGNWGCIQEVKSHYHTKAVSSYLGISFLTQKCANNSKSSSNW